MFLPGWLDVSRAREGVAKFSREASERQVETKVVMSAKYIENPFTWLRGKPIMVVARKPVDGDFLILFANFSEDDQSRNKALVSADCSGNKLRVVSQGNYEKYLSESGYSVLGDKLPPWSSADYNSMLSVMLAQEYSPAGSSVFFNIACHWDRYSPVA